MDEPFDFWAHLETEVVTDLLGEFVQRQLSNTPHHQRARLRGVFHSDEVGKFRCLARAVFDAPTANAARTLKPAIELKNLVRLFIDGLPCFVYYLFRVHHD